MIVSVFEYLLEDEPWKMESLVVSQAVCTGNACESYASI